MLVVSSPSGAGKTSLTRRLIDAEDNIELSISVTTRSPRPHERDGTDYRFISVETFHNMRDTGELLEWAEVFDNFYGTPREPIVRALEAGRDVLFDIDWQGASQLRASMKDDMVSVFILPPSGRELERRLFERRQDDREVIERRLAGAAHEIEHWSEYDFVIVNDDFDRAFESLRCILCAERARTSRDRGAGSLASTLNEDLLKRLKS